MKTDIQRKSGTALQGGINDSRVFLFHEGLVFVIRLVMYYRDMGREVVDN